jgi:hypothetical protein
VNNTATTGPSASPTLSEDQLDDLIDRLQRLLAACGTNKNDQVIAAIGALIAERIDTKPRVLGMLKKLGFNTQHGSVMLDGGNKKMRHEIMWRLDKETGRYHLVD